jgi:hypothetical protein
MKPTSVKIDKATSKGRTTHLIFEGIFEGIDGVTPTAFSRLVLTERPHPTRLSSRTGVPGKLTCWGGSARGRDELENGELLNSAEKGGLRSSNNDG